MAQKAHWFLTVDWCNQGKRGVFCDRKGGAFSHPDAPLGLDEAEKILGPFALILAPKWLPLTEAELAQHKAWYPLAEFSNEYGYAVAEANDGRSTR